MNYTTAILLLFLLLMMGCAEVKEATPTYLSKEECEQAENCTCDFVMCDYIPEGKTFEEVCGKDFRKGWQCIGQNAE